MSISSKNSKSIGRLLIENGLVTTEALQHALDEQEKSGGLIGDILMRLGVIKEDVFYKTLSEQFDMDYVKIKDVNINISIINEIPAKLVCHYALMPLKIENNLLTVAVSRPLDLHVRDDIKLLLKRNIKTVLATENDIVQAIKKYYGVGAETIEKITTDLSQGKFISVQSHETQEIVGSAD